jgi:hypothetical protein
MAEISYSFTQDGFVYTQSGGSFCEGYPDIHYATWMWSSAVQVTRIHPDFYRIGWFNNEYPDPNMSSYSDGTYTYSPEGGWPDGVYVVRWVSAMTFTGVGDDIIYLQLPTSEYYHFNDDWEPGGESGLPEKAINPTPEDNAEGIDWRNKILSWENGGGATSYNVYVGIPYGYGYPMFCVGTTEAISIEIDYESVLSSDNASRLAYLHGIPVYWNTGIVWRVDSVNDNGTTTGDQWAFDPRPIAYANNPTPTHGAEDVSLNTTTLEWGVSGDDSNIDYWDMYISDPGEDVSFREYNIPGTSYDLISPGLYLPLEYESYYQWEPRPVNEFGTGVYSGSFLFTTLAFNPPISSTSQWYDYYGEPGELGPWTYYTGDNFMCLTKRLIALAGNALFYESQGN